ncbi:MAG: ATP synthase F0 subunit C [Candidatus Cloacimonetes bacterium]|nr:ATP synthase F0 subunit C [Candidatus Cloacimonadota bacterium]
MFDTVSLIHVAAYIGAGLAVGISSIGAGVGEGYIAGNANYAMMKQPKSNDVLLRTMLIAQAITETGAIFALVIAMLLLFGGSIVPDAGWQRIASLFGAGLVMGAGCLGTGLGIGYAGGQACQGIGRQPREAKTLTANMLIGQALSETSAIFALVIAMLLLYSTPDGNSVVKSFAFIGAAFAMGFGTFGPGFGIGIVAGKTVDGISRFPKQSSVLLRTMFVGAAVSESTSIYALVIAFLLLFVT